MACPVIESSCASAGAPRRASTLETVRGATVTSSAIRWRPSRCSMRHRTISSSIPSGVRVGDERGREERSCRPSLPCSSNTSIQCETHLREQPIALAIYDFGQPARWRAMTSSLAFGVRRALA